ncbi:MAG TPA: M23 family metallopeptidase [Candidatus Avacidaminococcus intestinavium]|uniref:M23 family metallopeptidase n=1 Tax=Candidatus Avacidaminococcus intestinavium TaxID=2840684 RepID=A0A9D1MPD1_9FIRM|nr:M23 family metallopeptidase [Candidatus Avacidaminococcus intestinavium]
MNEQKKITTNQEYFLIAIAGHGKGTKVLRLHKVATLFVCCFLALGIYGLFRETYDAIHKADAEQQELFAYRAQYAQQEEKLQVLMEENEKIQKKLAEVATLEDEVRRTLDKDGATVSRGNNERLVRNIEGGQGGPGNAALTKFDIVENQNKMLAENIASKYQNLNNMLEDLRAASTVPSLWPAESWDISSRFGYRADPFGYGGEFHKGIDIAGNYGEPVYATAAGTVETAGWYSGYGRYVKLEHGNGYASAYGHMSAIAVAPGDNVAKGDVIGYIGSSGYSTGPHLHFEVLVSGSQVDPLKVLNY